MVGFWSWGSSVRIVSDYGLDDRAIEVRSDKPDESSPQPTTLFS
jgi:hypothetical protein